MENKKPNKVLEFVVKTMNGMAYGLFATLIIGTILGTIGGFFTEGSIVHQSIIQVSTLLKMLMGMGIGLGIAWSMKLDGLKLIMAAVVGQVATYMSGNVGFKFGDPLVVYLVVIVTISLMQFVLRRKTPVDILIIPLFATIVALGITLLINQHISNVTKAIGDFVNQATEYQPFFMGIIIAVVMGMALTSPISSAAISVTIGLSGLAAGAAVVGCSVQMIGFAVMSRKDNNVGTILSVGFGTSMLQFKNILRKPIIWLPTIIVSAVLGPFATIVFNLMCNMEGAGMGTSGLVGPINVYATMGSSVDTWLGIGILMFAAPIILVWGCDLLFRKFNLIGKDDLKI